MPVLTLPTAATVPRILPETRGVPYLLMRHYSNLLCGQSIVRIGNQYRLMENPSQDQLTAAGEEGTGWFLGGHGPYTITAGVASALTADGFGAFVD